MLVAQADVPVQMDYIITEGRPELTNSDWRRHRRTVNPTLRNLPLIVFVEFAAKLLDIMEKVDNKPIEISNLMRRLTLDVLGKTSFLNLENPKNIYVTTYNEVTRELGNAI
ncbi:hypothetical protein RhiirA5_485485 [Rhizophagus irregularis]|uniref:Uncharacterized protein n=1 Tax=Rhizophagus irregularis TaxID=588596 RepID=A0A2N0PF34_9GLOM|nr:hypothetical protein RhiirA5_485485 [Rhizophagus irregularis]